MESHESFGTNSPLHNTSQDEPEGRDALFELLNHKSAFAPDKVVKLQYLVKMFYNQ